MAESSIPAWALSLTYWLHMLATIAWIGDLAAVSLFTFPAVKKLVAPDKQLDLLHQTQRRLESIGWFSLAVLIGTGLIQMSVNENYEGVLTISNDWAEAILLKHIVFFGMIGISSYLTWFAMPDLQRAVLKLATGKGEVPNTGSLFKKHSLLLRINLLLGLLVLVFTAMARVAA